MLVREFGHRMVCTRYGIVGADARLGWREMQERELRIRLGAAT